ncbi:hypothetical protein M885DRAFT_571719 [Pelagophyceae sp. CCMP2097]|nr:hypothetical protein M885DRAFT_571719 [Pelagophyceae sp. CCMP2097]|mmetsp:Transcript_185/g.691  ORF Transcript_185/g.691 Transcript_185/m.691 type:complete len:809 (-) Transcript_185:872-3298(-)
MSELPSTCVFAGDAESASAQHLLGLLQQAGAADAGLVKFSRKAASELSAARVVVIFAPKEADEGFDRFWRFLGKVTDPLESKFAVFGDHPKLTAKLAALGATPLLENAPSNLDAWCAAVVSKAVTPGGAIAAAETEVEDVSGERSGVAVLYGSQTGNAASISAALFAELKQRGAKRAWLGSLDEWRSSGGLASYDCAIVVTSTTGNGDAPEGAEQMWRWVRRRERAKAAELGGVRFCVLALGDTNYDKFCEAGKVIDRRFTDLGAERLMKIACADEAIGLEGIVDPWLRDLYKMLSCRGIIKASEEKDLETDAPPPEIVQLDTVMGEPAAQGPRSVRDIDVKAALKASPRALEAKYLPKVLAAAAPAPKADGEGFSSRRPYSANVVTARDLCAAGDRRVIHVEMELGPQGYEPGDSVGIKCPNPLHAIQDAARACGGAAAEAFDDADLCAAPTRGVLRTLAGWCSDEKERDVCLLLSSRPAGELLYDAFVATPRLRVHELLNMLPSCRPSAQDLAAALPRQSARYYSIASCPLWGCAEGRKNVGSVAFSTVRFDTPQVSSPAGKVVQRPVHRSGLCTTWLESLLMPGGSLYEAGAKVPLDVFVKKSDAFKLPPADSTANILMVGPGTGVAPFLGFIEHQKRRTTSAPPAAPLPGSRPAMPGSRPAMPGSRPQLARPAAPAAAQLTLYHGCRQRDTDWLYKESVEGYVRSGALSRFRLACSRDQAQKIYVQHQICEDAEIVSKHLEAQGYVYICGDGSRMAKDVYAAFCAALVETETDCNLAAAQMRLEKLKEAGRYLVDIWSPVDEYD